MDSVHVVVSACNLLVNEVSLAKRHRQIDSQCVFVFPKDSNGMSSGGADMRPSFDHQCRFAARKLIDVPSLRAPQFWYVTVAIMRPDGDGSSDSTLLSQQEAHAVQLMQTSSRRRSAIAGA
jgi:hypothetical protein